MIHSYTLFNPLLCSHKIQQYYVCSEFCALQLNNFTAPVVHLSGVQLQHQSFGTGQLSMDSVPPLT